MIWAGQLPHGIFPNELIAHKWVTDGPDIWSDTIQFNKDCHPSIAKGFVWDSTDVTNEVVACTTVLNKYKRDWKQGMWIRIPYGIR